MKILHLSDLHAVERFYAWVADEVRRTHYDALVVSGDLLDLLADGPELPDDFTDLPFIQPQIKLVTDWAANLPADLPMFLCSGNHDKLADNHFLKEARWLLSLKRRNLFVDGDSTNLGYYNFECVGWGRVPIAATKLPKIVVSHSPPSPAPTGIDHLGMDHGSPALSAHILLSWNDATVLCGHVHQPRRWHNFGAIISLNPGADREAATPNHIVIDTDTRAATLVIGDSRRQTVKL
ncbi:MAG TPA: metallophosphoesterase [Opitutaceae bacterium]|jgi:Icc-related predicted phosphoesterase|nr:metallophosphoesterase [Opitutaceae bacterium]